MATTFDRLVAAGAPVIYDPYFYRLRNEGPFIRAEVRKRNARFGSRLLGTSSAYPDPDQPELTLGLVVTALTEAVSAMAADTAAAALAGDYAASDG